MKRIFTIFLLGVVLVSLSGIAQAELLSKGDELYNKGAYEAAIKEYEKLFKEETKERKKPRHLTGWARSLMAIGKYDEAKAKFEEAVTKYPKYGKGLNYYGEYLAYRGEYEKAIEYFDKAAAIDLEDELYLRPIVNKGQVLQILGKDKEANEAFIKVIGYYENKPESAEQIMQVARACFYSREFQEASSFFDLANDTDINNTDVLIEWGQIYLAKYNVPDAHKCFNDPEGITANPKRKERHVGMSKVLMRLGKFDIVQKELDAAFKIDPNYLDAHLAQSLLDFTFERNDKAIENIDKALAVNPKHVDALAFKASIYYCTDKKDKFEEYRKKVEAINPKTNIVYRTCGDSLAMFIRTDEAMKMYEKAKEIEATDADIYASLGLQYMRAGFEEKAKEEFEDAYKKDPFHIRAFNQRTILKFLHDPEYFTTFNTDLYTLRMKEESVPILYPYFKDIIDKEFNGLSKRFGVKQTDLGQTNKLLIEVFKRHDYFAGRTTGLPTIAANGACFGRVITLLEAKENMFNWEIVFKHELAHTMSITRSKYRIPRWFTEGISVFAEDHSKVGNDYFLFAGIEDGTFMKIGDLNSGFSRPTDGFLQVMIAYTQAFYFTKYVADNFDGDKTILKMLDLYAAGKTTEEVFKEALGKSVEEVEKLSYDYAVKRAEEFALKPLLGRKDFDRLGAAIKEDPMNVQLKAELAQAYLNVVPRGKKKVGFGGVIIDEKKVFTKKAYALLNQGMQIDPNNPLLNAIIGDIKLDGMSADPPGAIKCFNIVLADNPNSGRGHIGIATAYAMSKQMSKAIEHLKKAIELKPRALRPINPYAFLGQYYYKTAVADPENIKMEMVDESIKYLEMLRKLNVDDMDCRMHLGDIYMRRKNDMKKAEDCYKEAIFIAPYLFHPHKKLIAIYKNNKEWEKVLASYEALIPLAENEETLFEPEIFMELIDLCDQLSEEGKNKYFVEKTKYYEAQLEKWTKILEEGGDPNDENYE